MKITYDPLARAVYIDCRDEPTCWIVSEDYGEPGKLKSIEILNVDNEPKVEILKTLLP